jgi:hypothetical protein
MASNSINQAVSSRNFPIFFHSSLADEHLFVRKMPESFPPLDADGDELHRDAGTGLSHGWPLRHVSIGAKL